jgi:hypothetical protein
VGPQLILASYRHTIFFFININIFITKIYSFLIFFFCNRSFEIGFKKLSDTSGIYDLAVISQITLVSDLEFNSESIVRCDDESNDGRIVVESGGSMRYKGKTGDPSEIIGLVFCPPSISSIFNLNF